MCVFIYVYKKMYVNTYLCAYAYIYFLAQCNEKGEEKGHSGN